MYLWVIGYELWFMHNSDKCTVFALSTVCLMCAQNLLPSLVWKHEVFSDLKHLHVVFTLSILFLFAAVCICLCYHFFSVMLSRCCYMYSMFPLCQDIHTAYMTTKCPLYVIMFMSLCRYVALPLGFEKWCATFNFSFVNFFFYHV